MIVKLLTEHYLGFLSLKGGCPGSSESTLVKMPNCWKSHALAHIEMRTTTLLISPQDLNLCVEFTLLVSFTDLHPFICIFRYSKTRL